MYELLIIKKTGTVKEIENFDVAMKEFSEFVLDDSISELILSSKGVVLKKYFNYINDENYMSNKENIKIHPNQSSIEDFL